MNVLGLDTATPVDGRRARAAARLRSPRRATTPSPARARATRSALLALAAGLLRRAGLRLGAARRGRRRRRPGRLHGPAHRARHRPRARAARAARGWSASARCARSPSRCAARAAAAVLDARRGEAFVAVYRDGRASCSRRACARRRSSPAGRRTAARTALAVGDGALRFRRVPRGRTASRSRRRRARSTGSARRRSAGSPRAGASRAPVPDYLRLADAERAQRRARHDRAADHSRSAP